MTEVPAPSSAVPVLGRVLAALLGAHSLVALAVVGLHLWGLATIPAEVGPGRKPGDIDTFNSVTQTIGSVLSPLFILTAILWCVWQYRLAASTDPAELRNAPWLHVVWWLIPLVSWVMAILTVIELWRAWLPTRRLNLVFGWWTAWVGTNVILIVFSRMKLDGAGTPGHARAYMSLGAVSYALFAAAGVLAIFVVMRLSRAVSAQLSAQV